MSLVKKRSSGPTRKTRAQKKTSARKSAKASPPSKKAAKGGPRRKSAARTPTPESIARKIVRVTTQPPDPFDLADLYAAECSSLEAAQSEPIQGLEALRGKLAEWEGGIESQTWKAEHVFIKGRTICIEWKAEITFKGGREVTLREIAIHEVRGGKIVAERFYYNPAALAPPQPAGERASAQDPVPVEVPPYEPPTGSPPLDPMDI